MWKNITKKKKRNESGTLEIGFQKQRKKHAHMNSFPHDIQLHSIKLMLIVGGFGPDFYRTIFISISENDIFWEHLFDKRI